MAEIRRVGFHTQNVFLWNRRVFLVFDIESPADKWSSVDYPLASAEAPYSCRKIWENIYRSIHGLAFIMSYWEGSKQFLQKESSDGVPLYDHLSNVLLRVRCHMAILNCLRNQTFDFFHWIYVSSSRLATPSGVHWVSMIDYGSPQRSLIMPGYHPKISLYTIYARIYR